MKARLKRILGSLIYALLPRKWVWAVRMLPVPGSYRRILRHTETVLSLQEDSMDDGYWAQKLRKYVHILDKGLQKYDCEPGHSLPWYQLAREAMSQIQDPAVLQDQSMMWAKQKICEYEMLQNGKCPPRMDFETCGGYEELLNVIKTRRSTRLYSNKTVDVETIEKIIEVINWSPTSCNRQTAKVFVTNVPPLVQSCLKTCVGATNFSEFVPAFLCFCADLRAYEMPHEIYLPALDIALGIQNCCLVAHSLGLGITLLTWAQSTLDDERELYRLLGIPSHYQIIVNGTLGYPEYAPPVPLRKSLASTYVLK